MIDEWMDWADYQHLLTRKSDEAFKKETERLSKKNKKEKEIIQK